MAVTKILIGGIVRLREVITGIPVRDCGLEGGSPVQE